MECARLALRGEPIDKSAFVSYWGGGRWLRANRPEVRWASRLLRTIGGGVICILVLQVLLPLVSAPQMQSRSGQPCRKQTEAVCAGMGGHPDPECLIGRVDLGTSQPQQRTHSLVWSSAVPHLRLCAKTIRFAHGSKCVLHGKAPALKLRLATPSYTYLTTYPRRLWLRHPIAMASGIDLLRFSKVIFDPHQFSLLPNHLRIVQFLQHCCMFFVPGSYIPLLLLS